MDVTLGYLDRLDVMRVLARAAEREPAAFDGVDATEATFFVSDPLPRLARPGHLARWRQRLFVGPDRLAKDRVEHLDLPRDRTVIVGRDFDL